MTFIDYSSLLIYNIIANTIEKRDIMVYNNKKILALIRSSSISTKFRELLFGEKQF